MAIETPKTAGLRQVEPFQLNVPGAESDKVAGSFNPSDAVDSNQLGVNTESIMKLGVPSDKKGG